MASIRDVERAITKYQRRVREYLELYNSENKKLHEYYERDYYRIAREEIQAYYDEYHPRLYKRKFGLFGAPHYEIDDNGVITTKFIAQNIKYWHRISGLDYLMQLTLEEGWHGGAKSGPPDRKLKPFPGVPGEDAYWRKPPPKNNRFIPGITYALWGRKAFRGDHQNIEERVDERYAEAIQERKDHRFNVLKDKLNSIIVEMTKVLEKLL